MNRTWLVGASEGIGRSLAIGLASKGYKLALSARQTDRLSNLASQLGPEHLAVPADVRDQTTLQQAWQKIIDEWSGVDVIIYNAGYYRPAAADNFNLEDAEAMIDVNLTGALRVLSLAIPAMIKQKRGKIVLIGSIAGYRGLPSAIGYGASKAGIIHLAENLRCDLSPYGIHIQLINPGFVKTRLTDLNTFSMPFLMSPEDAAESIMRSMEKNKFESRFPWLFANAVKLMRYLPSSLYFALIKWQKKLP